MNYFKYFHSNTVGGTSNQSYFTTENPDKIYTGRVFYKTLSGGTYNYSFLFSNIIDSTYADGSHSHKNLICDEWSIIGAAVAVCNDCSVEYMVEVGGLKPIKFNGKTGKNVMPGEFFSSDPIELTAEKGQYLCFEITFSGHMLPYHEECILPTFVSNGEKWEISKLLPLPAAVGCDRAVKADIAFLGDSITQGIGVPLNSYKHWDALIAERLSDDYSFWNLGIGYGRAEDAASDGAWLFKAKQNDAVAVCFGVNDILQNRSEQQIKDDLTRIVKILKASGVKVLLQTVPPFDYAGDNIQKWENINSYIKTELSKISDAFFDVAPVLRADENKPYNAKYGGHPNPDGSKAWADALYPLFKSFLADAFNNA